MKKIFSLAIILILCWFVVDLYAQCPMCKANVEAGLDKGGKTGLGLNTGILYLLAIPYLLVGAVGIWWWKNRK